MSTSIFSRLDRDIIHTHILPRLDGTTLTVLSSVCSKLRHMICHNNENLWRNIYTSKWPSLLKDPIVNNVISTFPGGYHSFFSDAFPSLHHLNNNSHCSYPPTIDLIHAFDIYIHGECLTSSVRVQSLNTNCLSFSDLFHVTFDDFNMGHIHNEEWEEYVAENLRLSWTDLRLSWIVIDPIRKHAANLIRSSCIPSSVGQTMHWWGPGEHKILYEMVMAGECQVPTEMEMVKCKVSVSCFPNDDGLHLKEVVVRMNDMISGNLVGLNQCVAILLNAIQNGEWKKFDLPRGRVCSNGG